MFARAKAPESQVDLFKSKMSGFLQGAKLLQKKAETKAEELNSAFKSLMEYMGESPDAKWEEFFALISDFVKMWKQEVAGLQAAESKRLKDERKAKRKASPKKPRSARRSTKERIDTQRYKTRVSCFLEHLLAKVKRFVFIGFLDQQGENKGG